MTVTSGETKIDRLESRAEILDLVSKYCLGCDRRNLEEFLSIWHDDGVFDLGELFGEYAGTAGIEEAANILWQALTFTRHWTTNLVIEFDGPDDATGRSDVTFDCEDAEGRFFIGAASYDDVFQRRDGIWKVSRRAVDIQYRKALDIPDYE